MPMTLTPQDIDELTFSTAFRGYNPDEVDAALDRIALLVHRMSRQIDELTAGAGAPTASNAPSDDGSAGSSTGDDVAALRAARDRAERESAELRDEVARLRRAQDAAWADARADQPRPVPPAVRDVATRQAGSW